MSKIQGWGRPKYWGRKRVAITYESIGISQLLGARAIPTPKVYAYYDEVKSNGNLTLQLYSITSYHEGNEAEILTIAILGENKFLPF